MTNTHSPFSQNHSFDIALAAQFGVEEAILIHHFQHWIRINARADRNNNKVKILGKNCMRTFTYQTYVQIAKHYPYWNDGRVKYLCKKLVKLGVIVKRRYNRRGFDKTNWYAFVDEVTFGVDADSIQKFDKESSRSPKKPKISSMEKSVHRMDKSDRPIPDTKPDTKPLISTGSSDPSLSKSEEVVDSKLEKANLLLGLCQHHKLPFKSALVMRWISSFGADRVGSNIKLFLETVKSKHIPSPEGWVYKACKENYSQKMLWQKTNRAWLQDFVKKTEWKNVETTVAYARLKSTQKEIFFKRDPLQFSLEMQYYYELEKEQCNI